MLLNVNPAAAMVTSETFSAVPLVEVRLLVPLELTVPLVVRLNAVPPVTVALKFDNNSVPTAVPVMPEPFEFVTYDACRRFDSDYPDSL